MQKVVEASDQKLTRYKNERKFPQSIVVNDNGRMVRYTWAPGEEKAIPSFWDYAVHRVHGKTVVGGLAPQLTNLDRPELKLAEALDTELQDRKKAEAEFLTAQVEKKKAEQEALLAAARLAQAESQAKASAPAPETKK